MAMLLSIGCGNKECFEDDSRNERKFITLLSPTFPSTSFFGGCPVPENPAFLLWTTNNDVDEVFNCRDNDSEILKVKWNLVLEVNGQCADGGRYIEEFRPNHNGFNCPSDVREMPIEAVTFDHSDFFIKMCPDPHVPNNFGIADYTFSLVVSSPSFGNTDNCSCENDPFGLFDESYIVRGRSDLILEDFPLSHNFDEHCGNLPLEFFQPIMYALDCI